MNQIDIEAPADKNPDGHDFVLKGSRFDLLENKVCLVVPDGNPAGIESFDDLQDAGLIAIGNSDVPVGSYSLEVLQYLGLDVTELEAAGKITYGSNVKEVVTQVSEGTVDCGIVYATRRLLRRSHGGGRGYEGDVLPDHLPCRRDEILPKRGGRAGFPGVFEDGPLCCRL